MELWYPQDFGRRWTRANAAYLQATDGKIGATFAIPKTGTITGIGFWISGLTNPQSISVLLEIPKTTTDGFGGAPPYNTDDPYGGCEAGVVASPTAVWTEVDFSHSAAAVAGDLVSFSLKFYGTPSGADEVRLGGAFPLEADALTSSWWVSGFPYMYMTRVSSASLFSVAPILALKYGTEWVHIPGCFSITGHGDIDFYGDANSERGNKIIPPTNMSIVGAYFIGHIRMPPPFEVVLYDDSDELAKVSDTSVIAEAPEYGFHQFTFPTTQLKEEGEYYIALRRAGTRTGAQIHLTYFDVPSAAVMGGMPEGTRIYGVKRPAAGGAWTEEATRRYRIGLIADVPGAQPGNFAHAAIG